MIRTPCSGRPNRAQSTIYWPPPVDTRKQRDRATRLAVGILKSVLAAQSQCLANTPENFQGTGQYESSELLADAIEEAVDILEDNC